MNGSKMTGEHSRIHFVHLHPAQREIFVDQLIHVDSPHYNVGGYIRILGNLNRDKLKMTARAAPKYLDSFRMRFSSESLETGFWLDNAFDDFEIGELDFRSSANPMVTASEWTQDRFNTAFSFESPLLFEQLLLQITENEHWFFTRFHHLITDGVGFTIWVDFIVKSYNATSDNELSSLVYPSYIDEISESLKYYSSERYDAERKYWREKIKGLPDKLLHTTYISRQASEERSGKRRVVISSEIQEQLYSISTQTGSNLQQLTLAALTILFGRTTDSREFVFGVPIHKRGSARRKRVFGMFSGIIPCQSKYDPNQTLNECLADIRRSQRQDYRFYNYLVSDFRTDVGSGSLDSRIFEIVVNYELLKFPLQFCDGLEAEVIQLSSNFEPTPLQISWRNFGDHQPLELHANFQHEYFSHQEIDFFLARIIDIIRQCSHLEKKLMDVVVVPPDEMTFISQNFGNVNRMDDGVQSIVHLFEEQVKRRSECIALVCDDQSFTFSELSEKADRVAGALMDRGLRQNDLVCISAERSAGTIIGILGILKAGGAFIPLSTDNPKDRINYILHDTNCKFGLCSDTFLERIDGGDPQVCWIDIDIAMKSPSPLKATVAENVDAIDGPGLAYVIYTSGSTGFPKGVAVQHAALADHVCGFIKGANLSGLSSFALCSPLSFDGGYSVLFSSLVLGGTVHVLTDNVLFNAYSASEYLTRNSIDCIKIVPSFWFSLVTSERIPLPNKVLVFGGEALPVSALELLVACKYKGEVYNHYGPTEATVGKCIYRVDLTTNYGRVPIGKGFSKSQLLLVSPGGDVAPIGSTGELIIGGVGLALGYLNRPELSFLKFSSHPTVDDGVARFYRTGDLCRWTGDGNIVFLGRTDDQVKVRGYRVELGEIETLVLQSGIVQQVVLMVKANEHSSGTIVGYVKVNRHFEVNELIDYLRGKLPEHMVPVFWREVDCIPTTHNGKIDKNKLPPIDINGSDEGYVGASNEIERILTDIWEHVLRISPIGVNHNLFMLGGDSLAGIKITSQIYKRMGVKIDLKAFFDGPSIRQIGRLISHKSTTSFSRIGKAKDQDDYDLSHSQKRIWAVTCFEGGDLTYNSTTVLKITGALDIVAFQNSFDSLVRLHEILRTTFPIIQGQPRQVIHPHVDHKFDIHQIDITKAADRSKALDDIIHNARVKRFDLNRGPLLNGILVWVEPGEFAFIFNIHHIICDGWSKQVLIRDFFKLYQNCIDKSSEEIRQPEVRYRDFVEWHGQRCLEQAGYWQGVLSERAMPVSTFPCDSKRTPLMTFEGDELRTSVPGHVAIGLRQLGRQTGISLNNLIFSLYALCVARFSGQKEVVIGSLVSGRTHPDLENIVGVFMNFLPITIRIGDNLTLHDYLIDCNDTILLGFSNQDYPFDLMVDKYMGRRDMARNPFFDTLVNFHSESDIIDQTWSASTDGIGIEVSERSYAMPAPSILDFKLDVTPDHGGIALQLSYKSKLFLKSTMQRFLDEFVNLVTGFYRPETLSTPLTDVAGFTRDIRQRDIDTELRTAINICSTFAMRPIMKYINYWDQELDLDLNVSLLQHFQIDPVSAWNEVSEAYIINVFIVRVSDWLPRAGSTFEGEEISLLGRYCSSLIDSLQISVNHRGMKCLVCVVPSLDMGGYSDVVLREVATVSNRIKAFCDKRHSIHMFDIYELAMLYKVDNIFDPVLGPRTNLALSEELYAALGTFIARAVSSVKGTGYRVIVLDCDNTLWGGNCGEVNVPELIINERFTTLQEFFVSKYDEGFLLALCSNNRESCVWEIFDRHPAMVLKGKHIAAHQINYETTVVNLHRLSEMLCLPLDSFIFVCDSAHEVELVSAGCPEVLAIQLPDLSQSHDEFMSHIWAFDRFWLAEAGIEGRESFGTECERVVER